MSSLNGFISVPRFSEVPRPTGAFFSATVDSKAGPNLWKVKIGNQVLMVTTDLNLVPGQTLKLKMASQQGNRWILQTVPEKVSVEPGAIKPNPLAAAFLSRGLPLAQETITAWTRWLGRSARPLDGEGWAASLEARGAHPSDPLAAGLQPWLAWQKSLEQGRPTPPPEDQDYWDLWNTRKTSAGDSWLVQPLRWEYEGREDSGLLQAHFNPQRQAIDQWNLTASPSGIPFRLEAQCSAGKLDLVWFLLDQADLSLWKKRALEWEKSLSTRDFQVTLKIAGHPPEQPFPPMPGGVDVQV